MAEFDYKQRPATNEYRENWDRVFKPRPVLKHVCRCGNDQYRCDANRNHLICTECGEDLW